MTLAIFHNPATQQPWQVRIVESVKDLATGIRAPSAEFIVLVAADARGLPAEEMALAAEGLLGTGARYICCWGPDCERFHDVCDECSYELGPLDAVVMTTSHAQESWEEALWFATHSAVPDDAYPEAAASVAVVVVGNTAWYKEACAYLGSGAPEPDETSLP
jgi:hypothetical protein